MVYLFSWLLALSHPVDPGHSPQATFIPVCRDGRGAWDRRACRHVRHNDPARLTLALLGEAFLAMG